MSGNKTEAGEEGSVKANIGPGTMERKEFGGGRGEPGSSRKGLSRGVKGPPHFLWMAGDGAGKQLKAS